MRDSDVQMARQPLSNEGLQRAHNNGVEPLEKNALENSDATLTNRWLLFVGWICLSALFFISPLAAFVRMIEAEDLSYDEQFAFGLRCVLAGIASSVARGGDAGHAVLG